MRQLILLYAAIVMFGSSISFVGVWLSLNFVIGPNKFVLRERSKTIVLAPSEYRLNYKIVWRFSGMKERLAFEKSGQPASVMKTKWMEIWKKPYNSGAVLYVREDGKKYYFGTFERIGIFTPEDRNLRVACGKLHIPETTPLGKRLEAGMNNAFKEEIDPGAPRFPDYIEAGELSTDLSNSSPMSKYYVGLRYLGKFGLVRGTDQSYAVGFVSSINSDEPRMALHILCG